MKWWIRSFGDCVFGTGIADEYTEETFFARSDMVQALRGNVRPDFSIDGSIALLGPTAPFTADRPLDAEVRILIVFDDAGGITLREDRERGVLGPRCPDPSNYCLAPLLLRPKE
jgi:hypothetical protein